MIEPNACRWCGIPKMSHYQRWVKEDRIGWHVFMQPSDEQRLQRMRDRRESRGKAMPKKGETLPFKVEFTYSANPAAGRDKDIHGVRPFRTEDEAMRDAVDLARRGALVTVDKKVGPITHHLVQLYPWTADQRRLAELADEVTELQHYEGGQQVHRMFDIQREMAELIAGIGVKRF